MGAINPNDLSKFSGIMEIRDAGSTGAWTRLPSVRGLTTTIDNTEIIEIKADDTGTVLKVANRKANFTFEFLENRNRDNLTLLFGGNSTNVAGTPVVVTAEPKGTGWVVGRPIRLNNKNGANTQVSTITVKANAIALVVTTNYVIYVGDGTNGDLGYTYIVPVTANALPITVDYTYTPNGSENLSLDLDTTELKNFEVKVTAIDGSKECITVISVATLNSEYSISYADVLEAGDITGSTLTFESNKGATLTYTNEII